MGPSNEPCNFERLKQAQLWLRIVQVIFCLALAASSALILTPAHMVTIGISAVGLLVSLLYLIGNAAGSPGLRRRLEGVLDVCLSAILCICFLALGAWLLLGARATGCLAPQKLPRSSQRVYKETNAASIPGKNIPCNGTDFCKICGGRSKVEEACNATAACVAYDFEVQGDNRDCGYLKSGVTWLVPRDGMTAYVMDSITPIMGMPAGMYDQVNGTNIPGRDLACGASAQKCRVCGGRAAVERRCNAEPKCRGYSVFASGKDVCGYLKDNPGPPEFSSGYTTYIKGSFPEATSGGARRLLALSLSSADSGWSLMPSVKTMCIVFDVSFVLAFVLGALFAGTAVVGGYAMRHGQGLLPLNVVREDEWKAAIDSIAPLPRK